MAFTCLVCLSLDVLGISGGSEIGLVCLCLVGGVAYAWLMALYDTSLKVIHRSYNPIESIYVVSLMLHGGAI